MKKYTTILTILIYGGILCSLICSCTTLINVQGPEINLFTEQKEVKVYFEDSTQFALTPAKLRVNRSKEPAVIHLNKDGQTRRFEIPSRIEWGFIYGNFMNGSAGTGILVDLTNQRRFKYPENIYVDMHDTTRTNYRLKTEYQLTNILIQPGFIHKRERFPRKKGEFRLGLSYSIGNDIVLRRKDGMGKQSGFIGGNVGLDYYYSEGKFYGLGYGKITDFPFILPTPIRYTDPHARAWCTYFTVTKGFDRARFSLGYGLSWVKYQWNLYEKIPSTESFEETYKVEDRKIGFSLQPSFNFTESFSIGAKYLPSIYSIRNHNFEYGHLLFLELILNFRINADKSMKKFKLENK